MLRKFAFIFINSTLCTLCIALVMLPLAPQSYAASRKKEMVVVIDPGHGGDKPGAAGRFSMEKDIVLKVSKKVGEILVKSHPDVEIVYTRTRDDSIDLADRGLLANKLNADLFVSIHANSDQARTGMGTETWVMGLDKTEKNMEVAMMENAEVVYEDGYETKYEGYDPNSPESFIMFSFMQNTHMEQSLYFASLVEKELVSRTKRKSRGVKQGPFLVLWRTNMPSALIEIGFISNREEEKYIASEKGQNEIAQAIVSAIGEYKKRWAKMQDGATAQAASKPSAKPDNVAAKSSASSTTPAAERLPARPTSLATYHIQIFSTSRILKNNSREFKGLKGAAYYRSGKSYRYYVGSYSTEKDANKSLREVKTKFPDAFVVKLRNGKPE